MLAVSQDANTLSCTTSKTTKRPGGAVLVRPLCTTRSMRHAPANYVAALNVATAHYGGIKGSIPALLQPIIASLQPKVLCRHHHKVRDCFIVNNE